MINMGLVPAIPPYITFPVYGLTRPLHQLVCYKAGYPDEYFELGKGVALAYSSKKYEQKVKREVELCWGGVLRPIQSLHLVQTKGSARERKHFCKCPHYGSQSRTELEDTLYRFSSLSNMAKLLRNQEVLIDGEPFLGSLQLYSSPAWVTFAAFGSLSTSIRATFYGPDVQEVLEILQSLRVLNRKQVD